MRGWALLLGALAPVLAAHADYAITARIAGPDGMWDYATVDPGSRRLYFGQTGQISMLALTEGGGWTQMGVPNAMWHGVLPDASRHLVYAANGQSHAVTVFDTGTHAILASIPTSSGPKSILSGKMARFAVLADPDALAFEPLTGLLAAVNGGSGDVALLDVATLTVTATVHVGGKLEFIVADGKGRLYVNVESAHAIAVIDVRTRKLERKYVLNHCVEPKGLAYDEPSGLLVATCDNGVAQFIHADSGLVAASRTIGRGADAVMVDTKRRRAFVPSSVDANLSIFDLGDARHIRLLQVLATEPGVRLGAVDPDTGTLYLPAGRLGPPIAPYPWPSIVPGSFHVLVVTGDDGPH